MRQNSCFNETKPYLRIVTLKREAFSGTGKCSWFAYSESEVGMYVTQTAVLTKIFLLAHSWTFKIRFILWRFLGAIRLFPTLFSCLLNNFMIIIF